MQKDNELSGKSNKRRQTIQQSTADGSTSNQIKRQVARDALTALEQSGEQCHNIFFGTASPQMEENIEREENSRSYSFSSDGSNFESRAYDLFFCLSKGKDQLSCEVLDRQLSALDIDEQVLQEISRQLKLESATHITYTQWVELLASLRQNDAVKGSEFPEDGEELAQCFDSDDTLGLLQARVQRQQLQLQAYREHLEALALEYTQDMQLADRKIVQLTQDVRSSHAKATWSSRQLDLAKQQMLSLTMAKKQLEQRAHALTDQLEGVHRRTKAQVQRTSRAMRDAEARVASLSSELSDSVCRNKLLKLRVRRAESKINSLRRIARHMTTTTTTTTTTSTTTTPSPSTPPTPGVDNAPSKQQANAELLLEIKTLRTELMSKQRELKRVMQSVASMNVDEELSATVKQGAWRDESPSALWSADMEALEAGPFQDESNGVDSPKSDPENDPDTTRELASTPARTTESEQLSTPEKSEADDEEGGDAMSEEGSARQLSELVASLRQEKESAARRMRELEEEKQALLERLKSVHPRREPDQIPPSSDVAAKAEEDTSPTMTGPASQELDAASASAHLLPSSLRMLMPLATGDSPLQRILRDSSVGMPGPSSTPTAPPSSLLSPSSSSLSPSSQLSSPSLSPSSATSSPPPSSAAASPPPSSQPPSSTPSSPSLPASLSPLDPSVFTPLDAVTDLSFFSAIANDTTSDTTSTDTQPTTVTQPTVTAPPFSTLRSLLSEAEVNDLSSNTFMNAFLPPSNLMPSFLNSNPKFES